MKKVSLSWHDLITLFWNVSSVRTFNGKHFIVKPTLEGRGFVFVEKKTGYVKEVPEIFYHIQTVYDQSKQVMASRSHRHADLILFVQELHKKYSFGKLKQNQHAIFTVKRFKKRVGNLSNKQLKIWEESGVIIPDISRTGARLYRYDDVKKAKQLLQM